ncbi:hypothetical protein DACRYDRAFT_91618 [Dacryopinax primogenitus]|uniref:Helitron helicase-like domain-containing protein n=1 Tax=Dacryopinax primogenitus (strain DJM 731) TaxID=1858805 RepID=M5FNE2_DACPD|nr:uncharacterized protein DACRYDRAFT_91618 [Dacryopinax primogenitus]EJT97290.1 hypothetical protein DACRYDRAFT_91618 [Dacryopinax primogenitus]
MDSENKEGVYAVRHSQKPVNDFRQSESSTEVSPINRNPLAVTFIMLFPYREGDPEDDQPRKVSFMEHARWMLQYHDRHFRKNNTWIFVAFGIIQKHEAMASAWIQIRHTDFQKASNLLSTVTIEWLQSATEEEESTGRTSNPAINTLAGCVMGSDSSCIALRSQIWGTAVYLAPPNLWFTITPNDLHNPLAQVFTGKDINMNCFLSTIGLNTSKRAQIIAQDPYAAAKFFQYIISSMMQCLFCIN